MAVTSIAADAGPIFEALSLLHWLHYGAGCWIENETSWADHNIPWARKGKKVILAAIAFHRPIRCLHNFMAGRDNLSISINKGLQDGINNNHFTLVCCKNVFCWTVFKCIRAFMENIIPVAGIVADGIAIRIWSIGWRSHAHKLRPIIHWAITWMRWNKRVMVGDYLKWTLVGSKESGVRRRDRIISSRLIEGIWSPVLLRSKDWSFWSERKNGNELEHILW